MRLRSLEGDVDSSIKLGQQRLCLKEVVGGFFARVKCQDSSK